MRRATIDCSSRSLTPCSSCSPRWSSTAGSALRRGAGERHGLGARLVLAHEQLGLAPTNAARACRRTSRSRRGRRRAGRRRQPPGRAAPRRERAPRGRAPPSRARRRGCGRRRPPRPARSEGGIAPATRGRWTGSGSSSGIEAGSSASARLSTRARPCARSGRTTTDTVIRTSPDAAPATARGAPTRRARASLLGSRSAVVGEGEATHEHRPGGGRAGGVARHVVDERAPAEVAARTATSRKRPAPRDSSAIAQPRPASTKPSRSGCSKQKKRSSGARALSTAADRSRSAGSDTVTAASAGALPPGPLGGELDASREQRLRLRAQPERAPCARSRRRHGSTG